MPSRLLKHSASTALMPSGNEDPLSRMLRPPNNETPSAKMERQRSEQQAKKRSDDIDKALKDEATRRKKDSAGEQRILLLGQAGAGKTTVLKQMRLLYDPSAHQRDRRSWKIVVFLNLIVAVRALLEAFEETLAANSAASASGMSRPASDDGGDEQVVAATSTLQLQSSSASISTSSSGSGNTALLARLRLAPLLSLEADLRARLGAVDEQVDLSDPTIASAALRASRAFQERDPASLSKGRARAGTANALLLRAGWQDRLLGRSRTSTDATCETLSLSPSSASARARSRLRRLQLPGRRRSASFAGARDVEDLENSPMPPPPLPASSAQLLNQSGCISTREDDVSRLLRASVDEVESIWKDERVRRLRRAQKIDERAEGATYFLENMHRIVEANYYATDDDIMRARVRTVGITEDKFVIDRSTTYRIFDVGGSRSQRNVWASFFEDARAVIFLAPISAFDQRLIEDPRVNRVEDSLALWAQIVDSPLLRKVSLILFLNKIDVLERKLASGVRVHRYFPDYLGDASDFESVWRFFRQKFRALAPKRPCYIHTTCATSTKQLKAILASVQDTIIRENLQSAGMV